MKGKYLSIVFMCLLILPFTSATSINYHQNIIIDSTFNIETTCPAVFVPPCTAIVFQPNGANETISITLPTGTSLTPYTPSQVGSHQVRVYSPAGLLGSQQSFFVIDNPWKADIETLQQEVAQLQQQLNQTPRQTNHTAEITQLQNQLTQTNQKVSLLQATIDDVQVQIKNIRKVVRLILCKLNILSCPDVTPL